MTECTLFKLPATFPLRELLHFKILIEAEPTVTPRFPPDCWSGGEHKAASHEFKRRSRCKTWQSAVCLWLLSLISWPQHEAKRMWAPHTRPPVTAPQRPRTRKSQNFRPPKTISCRYRCSFLTNNLMTALNSAYLRQSGCFKGEKREKEVWLTETETLSTVLVS